MLDKIIIDNEKVHNKIANKYNSRHIEIYNDIEQSRINNVISKLLELINKNNDKIEVLDYWSWTWNLTKFFLQNNCNVTSIDISDESLNFLQKLFLKYKKKLTVKKFDWYDIPFKDLSFDVVATYSVLHHIPDYMKAISDMIRVIKKWWYLYIDHESNINHWNPSNNLLKYRKLYDSLYHKVKSIVFTWEIFEFSFWKWVFIRKFINPRYVVEGDIHVWKDDFIDWEKIINYLEDNWFEIVENVDYLQYHPYVSVDIYEKFKNNVSDTKYIIARKK